jgi:hypothetical protein
MRCGAFKKEDYALLLVFCCVLLVPYRNANAATKTPPGDGDPCEVALRCVIPGTGEEMCATFSMPRGGWEAFHELCFHNIEKASDFFLDADGNTQTFLYKKLFTDDPNAVIRLLAKVAKSPKLDGAKRARLMSQSLVLVIDHSMSEKQRQTAAFIGQLTLINENEIAYAMASKLPPAEKQAIVEEAGPDVMRRYREHIKADPSRRLRRLDLLLQIPSQREAAEGFANEMDYIPEAARDRFGTLSAADRTKAAAQFAEASPETQLALYRKLVTEDLDAVIKLWAA